MNQGYGQGMVQQGYGQPAYGPDPATMGELRIHTSFLFLMWVLFFVSTRIEVNGQVINRPWGWSSFPLPAGTHQVRIAFNYMFGPMGGAMRNINIYPGHTSVLRYSAPFFIFMSGDLSEMPAQPTHMLPR